MVSSNVDGPLHGVKILDLTHVWAGPLAVRFLADLGAQVVKVEAPYGRGPREYPAQPIGGWLGGEPGAQPWNVNAIFNKLHRNRRSVCLDLKQTHGRETLLALVAIADVLIENFSADAMSRMGLGYDVLEHANPTLIYVTMPGYGASGPYRDRVAFGPTVEAMSGLSYMLGYGPDEPRNSAMALMDPIGATHSAAAVVTALRRRERDGKGTRVELSLHEGGVAFSGPWLLEQQMGGAPGCEGSRHPRMAPHGIYPCSDDDQWVAIACPDDQQWTALCSVIPGLQASMSLHDRRECEDEIDSAIAAWTSPRAKQSAAEELQNVGVAAGAVNAAPDMLADPQVRHREFFVSYERFDTPMPGNPIHMAGLDSGQWTRCPDLGEHNEAVLREWLGYDNERIRTLRDTGALLDKPPD